MKTNKTNTLKNSSGGGVLKGYYFSIFIVVLLTTTFLALNFIPLLTKTGNSNAETADVSVEIGPVLSLTLSENEITLNPNPVPEGTFVYDTLSAIVDTNNKTGYTLTMNTEEEETALAQEDGVTKIDSLADEAIITSTDQSNFTMNRWGYALTDTLTDSETSFLKIPALSTPATIKTSDAPVLDDATPVTLATKVDTSLPSGTYKNTLVFTAIANPITEPIKNFFDITTMQEMTAETCNTVDTPSKDAVTSVTTLAEYTDPNTQVPEVTLTDTRDDETYIVRKLADGNCWMSQNLRLQLSTSKALTPADSNVSTDWTPDLNSQTTTNIFWGGDSANEARSYVDTANKEYGGYYNWYAATASTGTYEMSTNGQETTASICPKGWRLPNGHTSNKSFFNLFISYFPDNISDDGYYGYGGTFAGELPFSFPLSGNYWHGGGSFESENVVGRWWSSTTYDANDAYYLDIYYSYSVNTRYHSNKIYGLSVRCVAR